VTLQERQAELAERKRQFVAYATALLNETRKGE